MRTMPMDRVNRPEELSGAAVARLPHIDIAQLPCRVRDEQFVNMLRGFRRSGGLSRGHDVASLLAGRTGLNIGTLARWIVEGEVIHFDWQQDTWLPMFQFGGAAMAPHVGVSRVLKELRGVLDPWEIAQWFACPSAALDGRTPADAMELDRDSVLHAARCDSRCGIVVG